MFAQQLDPSFEGKVDRLAPIAAAIAIAFAFILSLVVAISAVRTAEVAMARARVTPIQKVPAPKQVVTCDATPPARCG
ncbi:MAG: hypothetical protein IRZ16_03045 [Myxococcaceae bacterium]|nr:hypothetical protein [Myxococcaceae bacterium]